ncbi:MAG: hypothetical protein ACHQ3P_00125 [Candidatus Limnocylindrales bacterium]
MTDTVDDVVDRALAALDALGLLGEDVEDEWTYVTDLVVAQQARLEGIVDRRAGEPLSATRAAAVDAAIAETGAIVDPHRAIDWLSTFPDLVALALDEPIGSAADAVGGAGGRAGAGPR